MNIKSFGLVAVSAALVASGVSAQSTVTQTSGNVNAPRTALSVAPGIASGVKSLLSGNFGNNAANNNRVGPFLTPSVTIDYKNPTFDFNLAYELEMVTMRGFGKGIANKGFTNNSYFEHHPVSVAAFKFAPNWALNNLTEVIADMWTNDDDKALAITTITDVSHKVSSNLTLALGHRLDYLALYGSNIEVVGNFSIAKNATTKRAALAAMTPTEQASFKATNPNFGENPTDVLHTGIATATIGLGEGIKLKSYLMAGKGRNHGATNTDYYYYRANNDLTLSPIKNLDLALRYRLNLKNKQGDAGNDGAGSIQNLGRVIANYAVAKNWSLDLTNTFVSTSPLKNGSQTYENENYAGVSYKF